MPNAQMTAKMQSGPGFVAALDQSGGSTPKALALYGVAQESYSSDAEMFDLMHAMRTRIATAPAFQGDKVVGAILFEMTMDREINGKPSATYLWEDRGVVPFLKIDKGLEDASNAYARAIVHQRAVCSAAPEAVRYRLLLSKHFVNRGRVLRLQGNLVEAIRMAEARKILQSNEPEQLFGVAQELATIYAAMLNTSGAGVDAELCAELAVETLRESVAVGKSLPPDIMDMDAFSALTESSLFAAFAEQYKLRAR